MGAHSYEVEEANNNFMQADFWGMVFEKTIKTFAQTLLPFFAAGVGLFGMDWATILGAVGITTLGTFVLNVASSQVVLTDNFWIDSFQRAMKTFLVALAGLWLASNSIADVNWVETFSMATATGVLSLLTSIASRDSGEEKDNPSIVPVLK